MLWSFFWLIEYCWTTHSIIVQYHWDGNISCEGLLNSVLGLALTAFEQRLVFVLSHILGQGTFQFSLLFRQSSGYWWPILSLISTKRSIIYSLWKIVVHVLFFKSRQWMKVSSSGVWILTEISKVVEKQVNVWQKNVMVLWALDKALPIGTSSSSSLDCLKKCALNCTTYIFFPLKDGIGELWSRVIDSSSLGVARYEKNLNSSRQSSCE